MWRSVPPTGQPPATVGLNIVVLRYVHPGTIHYRIQYWPWAQFAIALSGGMGLIGVVLLLSFDVRGYIADHESSMVPESTN